MPNIPLIGRAGQQAINSLDAKLNSQNVTSDTMGFQPGDLGVTQTPTGTIVAKDNQVPVNLRFKCVLVDTGPNGEEDFNDERYWARAVVNVQNTREDFTGFTQYYFGDPTRSFYGVVINEAEMGMGTHALPTYFGTGDPLAGNDDTTFEFVVVEVLATPAFKFGGSNGNRSNTLMMMNQMPFARHAIITDAPSINGAIRYKYTIKLGYWDMSTDTANGGTWVQTSDDNLGDIYAYNSAEDMNTFTTGQGLIGTGNDNVFQSDGTIDTSDCQLLPLPVGGYVVVIPRGSDFSADSNTYWTIVNFANSSQGGGGSGLIDGGSSVS